jgi:hypothetical protein
MSGASHAALLMTYGAHIDIGTIYVEAQQQSVVNASSYNFTIDGHDAQSNRRIFVPVHYIEGSAHETISSVTINGQAATVRQIGHNGGSTGLGVAIASAVVASTSGNMTVTVNLSGTVTTCIIGAVVTYGFAASVHDFATDENAGSGTTLSVGVDVLEGGFVMAAYTGSTNMDDEDVVWSGVSEIYDFDTGDSGDMGRASLGFSSGMSAQTNRTIQAIVDFTIDSGNDMVVESWGLA